MRHRFFENGAPEINPMVLRFRLNGFPKINKNGWPFYVTFFGRNRDRIFGS